jgi:hypothetical protein
MKQHAASVSKAIKDIERVSQEVKNLETDLEATGSSRTADDVQNQLNDVSANLCVVPSCFLCYHVSGVLIASDVVDPMSVNVRHSKPRRRGLTML